MRPIHIQSVLTVLVLAATCQGGSIDFDSPPAGLVPNPSYGEGSAVSADAELTNQFEDLGAIFSTVGGAPFAALVDLGVGHAPSGANGIGAVNASGDLDYGLDIDIFLVVPGTLTPAVTDSISIQGDEIPSYGNVIFTAYDVNGNAIATNTIEDTGGNIFFLCRCRAFTNSACILPMPMSLTTISCSMSRPRRLCRVFPSRHTSDCWRCR